MKTPTRVLSAQGTLIKNGKTKGIWLWTADFIASKPDTVLNNCSQAHITEIYVPYATNKASNAQYRYFIGKATTLGIEIHALSGDSIWCIASHQQDGLDFIESVNSYNVASQANQRFKAIHMDNEPHGLLRGNYPIGVLPDNRLWTLGTSDYSARPTIIDEWITNTEVWTVRSHSYGMPLGGSFAHWLDDNSATGAPTPARFGSKKVSELMIDRYDYYGIMAYDDKVVNIQSFSNTEMNYAPSAKIVIAIETTTSSGVPDFNTFYQEGFLAAESALKTLDDANQIKPSYKGVAIHSYEQWEIFLAPYAKKNPIRTKVSVRIQMTLGN